MANKLTNNGLWESSRMMLPEHKEAYLKQQKEQQRRGRVDLDDQELELISIALQQSLQQRVSVEISMHHPFEQLLIVGVVERVDQQLKRFRVDGEWFALRDIEGIGKARSTLQQVTSPQ